LSEPIHVVAGVLQDAGGRVLLAERAVGTHLAGTWEFPGGKIEPGEAAEDALRRELHEELGVDIAEIEPLISIPWRYPGKSIVLHAYRVREFRGEPCGRQGQCVRWELPDTLAGGEGVAMPPPDVPIVTALRLPEIYVITPEPSDDLPSFLAGIDRLLAAGARLIQMRSKRLSVDRVHALAQAIRDRAREAGAELLLNGNIDLVRRLGLHGVHLPAAELMRLPERPLEVDHWVAASCHDERELAHAAAIGVDFAVLGTVQPTASHAGTRPLGWQRFAELVAAAPFPVYALGGLRLDDLGPARHAGAQGIAGISAFWPST
jgi:8-oxo-dGTP diphosphatase